VQEQTLVCLKGYKVNVVMDNVEVADQVPEDPPAALDNSAKPTEAGLDRNTV
jgi:hypothetical protein